MNKTSNKLFRLKPHTVNSFSLLLLCLIVITLFLYGCGSGDKPVESKMDTPPSEDAALELLTLQKGRLSSSLQVPGELLAFQQVDLYAKENSFVKKLYVDVGSEVTAGQLLVTMEAPELGSQLAGALSQIHSREAVYMASKANYDRLLETSKTPGTISPNDLEQAAARKNADYAQLQAAKANHLQVSELQKYLQIRAPFNGVITSRNINPGAYVGPSGKGSEVPLFTLQEQKKLRLVISVPESFSSYLSNKNEVSFSVQALPNQNFKAQIKRMSGAIDNRLHAQRVEMDVINNNRKLLPGMVAEVNLPLPANDSSFIVPKTAVVNSTESVFVIRVTDNKAEWVKVSTGRQADTKIEIYGDLNPGDHLVKFATDEIRNGSTLKNVKTTATN